MTSRGPSKTFTAILALLLLGPLALLWLDEGSRRSRGAQLNEIAHNLRILEGAKAQWVMEHHQTNGALPTPADLAHYLKNREFIEPAAGEIYTINPVGERITARLTRKLYNYDIGQSLTVTNF